MARRCDYRKGDTWRRVRLAILERDAHRCQLGYPGCTLHATQVDHIVPLSGDGAPYDPGNLRAVCVTCHRQRPNAASTQTSRSW